jgi:hypothetical protein
LSYSIANLLNLVCYTLNPNYYASKNFSDEDEIIFGRKDIQTIKTEMLEIKNWLSIQGLLDKIQTNTLYRLQTTMKNIQITLQRNISKTNHLAIQMSC